MAEVIRSKDNAQIKAARRLLDARERRAQGRLLIEGARLIGDAWESGFRPATCFWSADALGENSHARVLLGELAAAGAPCLECTPPVFATLVETVTPQGIAAVFPLPRLSIKADLDLALVLDGVRDPGNAGTLMRSAEAAGAQAVLFGPGSVDAFNAKVVRAAMGAHFRVPLRECAGWDEVQALLPKDSALYVATTEASLAYDEVDWAAPSALIVGGEATGPGAAALASARAIAIPMQGKTESLNAAIAGAVILFEAARRRRHGSPP